jgi:hypothetical protein
MRIRQAVETVLLSTGASVLYGILHDQVTARVCVEYFTVGHPPVFGTDDPTLLGLGWGVIATWWMGLLLGIWLAVVAQVGRRPVVPPGALVRPIAVLLAVMGISALCAGLAGWAAGSSGLIQLPARLAARLPPESEVPFLADLFAHNASYAVGLVGGITLIVRISFSRSRKAPHPPAPGPDSEHGGLP